MPEDWKNRAMYGNVLRRIIIKQAERFEKTTDDDTAVKLATNISNMISRIDNLLKQEESKFMLRVEKLEERAGITKKKEITE